MGTVTDHPLHKNDPGSLVKRFVLTLSMVTFYFSISLAKDGFIRHRCVRKNQQPTKTERAPKHEGIPAQCVR